MLIASFNLLSSSWSNITFLHPPPSLWHNSYTETAFKFPHGNSLFVSQLSDQLFLQSSVFWFLGLTSLLWWSFCSGSSLSSLGKGKKQIWELADVKIVFTLILENLFAYRMTEIIFPQMVEEIAHVTSKFPVLLLNVVVFQTCVWHYSQAHQRLLRLLFILGSLKAHEYRQLGHCRGPVNPLCYDWVTSCAPDISVPQFWKILMNATLFLHFVSGFILLSLEMASCGCCLCSTPVMMLSWLLCAANTLTQTLQRLCWLCHFCEHHLHFPDCSLLFLSLWFYDFLFHYSV